MAVDHVLSTAITNQEVTVPAVENSAGSGAQGEICYIDQSLVAVASSSQDATYRFVAVPFSAKVKRIRFTSQAQGAGTIDIGAYYPLIGPTAKADLAANAIDQDFFASAVAVTSASVWVDVTNESGTYTADKATQPLWAALGLTSNPGGLCHIAGTLAVAVTTGTGIMGLSVEYTQ